jgi:hypothetical protein
LALAHFKEGQSRQQMAIGITLKSTLMSTTNRPIFIVCSISKAFHGYPADPNTLNNQKKRKNGLKKMRIEMIKLIPGHLPLDRVDIWFQDEARFGQQNTTTRLWAKTGSRPRVIKQ